MLKFTIVVLLLHFFLLTVASITDQPTRPVPTSQQKDKRSQRKKKKEILKIITGWSCSFFLSSFFVIQIFPFILLLVYFIPFYSIYIWKDNKVLFYNLSRPRPMTYSFFSHSMWLNILPVWNYWIINWITIFIRTERKMAPYIGYGFRVAGEARKTCNTIFISPLTYEKCQDQ